MAGYLAYYLSVGLRPDSPVQNPEKLRSEWGLVLYGVATLGLVLLLMFADIPVLYRIFNVESPSFEPLWRIGR